MHPWLRRLVWLHLVLVGLALLGAVPAGAQGSTRVVVGQVRGIINPLSASYVERLIEEGERQGAAAVVLQLDTPGGLDSSMREIIQRILRSTVPVILYVSPPGGRAGSAGVYIAYAAHLAAMAPNTNIGSATPVAMGEGGEAKLSPEMKAKIHNDAVAYIRSLAEQRGRNVEWAEKAVREGANVSASQAFELKVVDIVAADVRTVLQQADGRTVQTARGAVVLKTSEAAIESLEMSPLERFLHTITDPTIAYILLSLGSLGLMLELYNPGQVLPGIVGVICLLLAFYALGMLPVNYAGLGLLLFGIFLFVLELFAPSHGALLVGGIASFLIGSLLLFNAPEGAPYLQVSFLAVGTMTAALAAFAVLVVGAVLRSRKRKVVTGREGLLGQEAEVRTPLDPEGLVYVESELWRARVDGRRMEPGERVRVTAVDGLRLSVVPLDVSPPIGAGGAAPVPGGPAGAGAGAPREAGGRA